MSDIPFQNHKYSFMFSLFLPLFPDKFLQQRPLCVNFILYVVYTLTLTLLPSSPATISTVTKPRWLSSVRTSVSRRGDPALRFGPLMEGTDSIPLEGLTNGIRGRTGFTCKQWGKYDTNYINWCNHKCNQRKKFQRIWDTTVAIVYLPMLYKYTSGPLQQYNTYIGS